MTTTIEVSSNHHVIEIDHIDVSEGYEMGRTSEIVTPHKTRLVHIWAGREVRIRELDKEKIMKYGLWTEELGWVQEFQEFTEKNGDLKRVEFYSRDEAEAMALSFGPGVKVKEIPEAE